MQPRIPLFIAAILFQLLCCAARAEEDKTPWGETKDGMALSLQMRTDYCVGEPITPVVLIKNVGDKERTLLKFSLQDQAYTDGKLWQMSLNSDGRPLSLRQRSGYGEAFGPNQFKPIAPNGTESVSLKDLRTTVGEVFLSPGAYTLTLTYFGAKPSKALVGTKREADGSLTHEYATPTEEDGQKAWKGELLSNTVKFTVRAPNKDDLVVHEWGVFSVYTDVKSANAGSKAEWAELPDFFYRQFPKEHLRWSPAQWNKPIIYFHTQLETLEVKVRVDFPQGAPVVWWPCCFEPHDSSTDRKPNARAEPFRYLEWLASVGSEPRLEKRTLIDRRNPKPKLVETALPDGCWLLAARDVRDVAMVGVTAGHSSPLEFERFIYYDGLVPAPDFLACTKSEAGSITLKNNAAFAMTHLFIVDRRDPAANRMAYLADGLAAGAEQAIKLEPVVAAEWPASGLKQLTAAMVAAGLTESEAASAAGIWRKGFFENTGVCAFYLLPQSEYDRMLPLTITPKPHGIARVGIAFHPWIDGEPELTKKVLEQIKILGEGDFDTREAAMKQIAETGGVAIRLVRKAAETTQDPEVRTRCQTILENIDASTWLEKTAKDTGIVKPPAKQPSRK